MATKTSLPASDAIIVQQPSPVALGWLLAGLPFAFFVFVAAQMPAILNGQTLTASIEWLPTLGVRFGFYLDGLSALFALLVSGIGAGILVYTGYYFQPHRETRFFLYLLLFMISMLGLVLASDIITLFVFWEGTSITSFLLVAYKSNYEAARRGAFKALFITGGGGIALLAGLIIAASVAGTSDLGQILSSGDVLRASPLYPVMLGLIAIGAFTKSAQFPAHFWLPSAMSAPTPASAFLHSATMVKAGLYLMARLYPALGGTEMWFWLLTVVGAITMLTGAIIGLRQNDLKGLLAYATVSQLGILMMLLGQREGAAFKAFMVGLLAHAFYKASLFLLVGILDHATGTRDLRRFAHLRLAKAMPRTLLIASLAALSMAGLPPLFGFLAKETLLAALLADGLPVVIANVLLAASVLTGALFLVQGGIFVVDTFFGRAPVQAHSPSDHHAHDPAWGMLLTPLVLIVLSFVFSLEQVLPILPIDTVVAAAAAAAFGSKVKVNLDLYHGINTPLILSGIAIALGATVFVLRGRLINRQALATAPHRFSVEPVYSGVLTGLDRLAGLAVRLQSGSLRRYLSIMLLLMVGLAVFVGRMPMGDLTRLSFGSFSVLRAASLLLSVGAAAASVVLKRDLQAIVALGASGIAMALLIALEPSPDVALVQIVVDILTTLLLVFALVKMGGQQKVEGSEQRTETSGVLGLQPTLHSSHRIGNIAVSIAAGLVMTMLCLYAFTSRPRPSVVTPYYEENSKALTGAADIVGAIVVDFRGFDTMIEITVFSMAGLAVMTLLRFARKKHIEDDESTQSLDNLEDGSTAVPAALTASSPFLRMLAEVMMPLALLIGFVHMTYGHDQPGDGFTAGVIISMAIGFTHLVFGPSEARRRMPWLKPAFCIGAGILVVMLGSIAPALMGSTFFAPFNFGQALNLPLPYGFDFSTSWLFEIAICLAVSGSASFMVNTFVDEG